MTKKRTPVEKSAQKAVVEMRPGRNGHGMLRVGSVPGGNRGGTGRPRDVVRAAMLKALDDGLPDLLALAKSNDPTVRIKALDMLAKYGLGTSNESKNTLVDGRVLTREEREDRALTLLKGSKTA